MNELTQVENALPNSRVEESINPRADVFVAVDEDEVGQFFGVARRLDLDRIEGFGRRSDGVLAGHLRASE